MAHAPTIKKKVPWWSSGVVPVPRGFPPPALTAQARDQEMLPMLLAGAAFWTYGHADRLVATPPPLVARESVPETFPPPGQTTALSGAVPVPPGFPPRPLVAMEAELEPVAYQLQGASVIRSDQPPVLIVPTPRPVQAFQQDVSMVVFDFHAPFISPILVLTTSPTTTVVDTIMFSAGLMVLGEL